MVYLKCNKLNNFKKFSKIIVSDFVKNIKKLMVLQNGYISLPLYFIIIAIWLTIIYVKWQTMFSGILLRLYLHFKCKRYVTTDIYDIICSLSPPSRMFWFNI